MPGVFDIFEDVDVSVLDEILKKTSNELPRITALISNNVITELHNYWAAMAKGASPWGARYAAALVREPMTGQGGGTASVELDQEHPGAMFANMMENGVRSWSIKDALLASSRAKTSMRTGLKYLVVPFRWRTPGSTKATSSFSGVMPDEIYEAAKKGQTISAAQADAAGNPNLAGLRKVNKPPHSGYMTFRVVTEQSTGWMYPQKAPTPVFPKVLDHARELVKEVVEQFVESYAEDLAKEYG